jgi:hypothetical protein
MTTWELPDGWTLHASTEQIEVTRDGTMPPHEVDIVRRFVPGATTAWLVAPNGKEVPLAVPFTLEDVKRAIAQFDGQEAP